MATVFMVNKLPLEDKQLAVFCSLHKIAQMTILKIQNLCDTHGLPESSALNQSG